MKYLKEGMTVRELAAHLASLPEEQQGLKATYNDDCRCLALEAKNIMTVRVSEDAYGLPDWERRRPNEYSTVLLLGG